MQSKRSYSRLVVKVGSSLISANEKGIDLTCLKNIVSQIVTLFDENKEIVLVSSGAVACGMALLHLKKRPKTIASLQAAAAIGQIELMAIYRKLLERDKRFSAQLLLTWDDFEDRRRYLNVRQTLLHLLRNRVMPIINENDTVSTDEICFGDNDKLSALVASMLGVDLLLILSDVEGLYRLPQKEVIPLVEEITPQINRLCSNTAKEACVGGMSSKIRAIKIVTDVGIPAIIAGGRVRDVLLKAAAGESVGTLFAPRGSSIKGRKRWIACGVRPKGQIIVDEGAKAALVKNGRSLLSVGIVGVKGDFLAAETVSIIDLTQKEFARGEVNFSAQELEAHKGLRLKQEVVHRDNLVIL